MHGAALPEEQRAALSALKPTAGKGFYLAGGTGLCLHLGHRLSHDIDLFRDEPFAPEQLLHELELEGVLATNVRTQPNTLWFELAGVPVSLMRFPYPCIVPPQLEVAVPVASLEDIAAMKVEAIASRGARKDFYDLFCICPHIGGLKGAIAAFEQRFEAAHPDIVHRMKALTYFDDAEQEPEPELLQPIDWKQVRDFFESEARALWAGR